MKKIFYLGFFGLLLFEILNVYLIMPMPGSQQMNSIDVAYFLYQWRWAFRIVFAAMIIVGAYRFEWKSWWAPLLFLLLLVSVIYVVNFQMAADHMFYKPKQVLMVNEANNKVDSGRLVIGVINNGEAKAYPIRFLGYHHQVQDTVGGKPLLITYCTVCRTGRVYEPIVNGKPEQFRLVGMDHFNAMLEDATTKSWWRQATGEAITGKLKGQKLPEFFNIQTSLTKWLALNPNSLVMQEDPAFKNEYDTTGKFESGKSTSKLTGTDSLSWKDKSWVIGVKAGKEKKAYDWNELKEKRIINDTLDGKNIILVLAQDDKSFFAFENPDALNNFSLRNDTLVQNNHKYNIDGKGINSSANLKSLPAYQEFWHSWRTFNPETKK
ncbi:DUF3179 domain-containing (seleno)protein [Ferruginibacter paludis]|uniref:DUF3179 domain-containing (seleno)protein n=1 Tax=Ferruginibacter paludis TaxID=1310417 RepID=UPI0025B55350|nr:DUF3179 domain-containing (seleno)protein [Ferruginibacter paludis]MDN3659457.1 DUF3179 domain-containing (seleno)protein [Ferruginibacter paludis]